MAPNVKKKSNKITRLLTLESLNTKRRNIFLTFATFIGAVLLFISTYIFSYSIPKIDIQLQDIDGKIIDEDKNSHQLHILEQVAWLPYNLSKLIDLNPNPDPQIKRNFARVIRIANLTSLALMCWPNNPTAEEEANWQSQSLIMLEETRVRMLKVYFNRTELLRLERIEMSKKKQNVQMVAMLLQLFGLLTSGSATSLTLLRK